MVKYRLKQILATLNNIIVILLYYLCNVYCFFLGYLYLKQQESDKKKDLLSVYDDCEGKNK